MPKRAHDWYHGLRDIPSKGSLTGPVGGLAGIAAAREQHQGQFWTPNEVAAFMWGLVRPAIDRALDEYNGHRVTLFDNSFGSGRLFQFADPNRHRLIGCDIDSEVATMVSAAVRNAGFEFALEVGSMESFRPPECGVGLLNPAFSVRLDSPLTEDYGVNSHGRFGPKSASTTHRYALAQALCCCRIVAAVLPRSYADELLAGAGLRGRDHGRLAAVYHLPRRAFRSEGAEVDTSVLVFGNRGGRQAPVVEDVPWPPPAEPADLGLDAGYPNPHYGAGAPFSMLRAEVDADEPVITLPYTGDTRVRIAHDGRRVVLRFGCGMAEGMVLNRILGEPLYQREHRSRYSVRHAKGVRFAGQGALDLECYAAQADPVAAWRAFLDRVRSWGFEPDADPAIERWLARRARLYSVLRVPLRHVAANSDGGLRDWLGRQEKVVGVAGEAHPIYERSYGNSSYDVQEGDEVEFARVPGKDEWSFCHRQYSSSRDTASLMEHYSFPAFAPESAAWRVVHEGLSASHQPEFLAMLARIRGLGLDRWCSKAFQLHDLAEVAMRRGHTVVGWDMGLGKTRLALALCYLGGKRNVVAVEAHLVDEMLREIAALGIPADDFQVIGQPAHLHDLRRVNIVAYSRLRMLVDAKRSKLVTYGRALRRRVHTMVCDEAHLLRNPDTDQSQAVWAVSPKVRYAMSGTPIANYPRDVLPVVQWVAGDGTGFQRYGMHHPMMDNRNLEDMSVAGRGVDRFRDLFVTVEWITNEFAEDLRSGAKREIPRIKDVQAFRDMVAPVLKRRVSEEPEVARDVHIPRPSYTHTVLEWDRAHLAYYVTVAEDFVNWYRNMSEYQRRGNLIAILAKIQAVFTAANHPQGGVGEFGAYAARTSKQRAALARLVELTEAGHKTIFLAHSPSLVDLMAGWLEKAGIDGTVFHGGMTVAKRISALDSRFRFGDSPVLLATTGTLQTGYNIHQADRVLFYNRSWTPKVEQQAAARVLRPQQVRDVVVEFMHLRGSIDDYQAQMVEFKAEAMRAGLDFGDEDDGREFVHLETILGRFVEEFEAIHKVKVRPRGEPTEVA